MSDSRDRMPKAQTEVEEVGNGVSISEHDTQSQNCVMTHHLETHASASDPFEVLDFSDEDGEALLILLFIVHF
jgi:hypothetical protein